MKNKSTSLYIAISISVAATLLLALGAFTGGLLLAPHINSSAQAATLPPSIGAAQVAPDDTDLVAAYEQALIDIYNDTLPSVVSIRVTKKLDFGFQHPPLEPDSEEDPEEFFNRGGGSGFVWDTAGHIVTNHHVIAGATDVEVIFADDTRVKAQVVGSDPNADLAVIRVDMPASALTPIAQGNSDTLQVGQLSVAIGNPFGQEFTMTSGIVSAVGRTIRSGNSGFSIPEVIQTDAPINPGNSGGPLLNRQGQVIGINTQILSRSGSSSGIGFAVPINIAKRVVPTLIQGDTFDYPWLGISGNTLTVEAAEFRNLPADTQGAVVLEVIPDGPAEKAGLQGRDASLDEESDAYRFSGEIITAINGQPIHDMDDLITYLVNEAAPGDEITVDVIKNDGTPDSLEVTLGVRPTSDNFAPSEEE